MTLASEFPVDAPAQQIPEPAETPTPPPDTPTEDAWERVQARGLTDASKKDLLTVLDGDVGTVRQRWEIEGELRRRAEVQLRLAARAATDADRTLTADRVTQLRDAIHTVGERVPRGDYVSMADLRAALPPDMSRAEIDATLKRLSRSGEIDLTPKPAGFSRVQTDHENAIWLGGEPNHLITWNRP